MSVYLSRYVKAQTTSVNVNVCSLRHTLYFIVLSFSTHHVTNTPLTIFAWPFQVPGCLTAVAPDDCPEKQAGIRCRPNRPGIFDVIERPVVLHVGPDVPNAMSCMILADGVLMGCSTFGQVAGLLSQGISFFSMQCSGEVTPNHYKIIPPIAVSERGYLWVPMAGSWRDPIIYSTEVLIGALDALLENKAIPSG